MIMPTMGRPITASEQNFGGIKMAPPEIKQNLKDGESSEFQSALQKKVNVGEELNKLSGIKPETKFVDRKSKETLGQDGFMKLLAHQLKHQDPLKPMDQKDFSANLAQFSQLEQLTNMNKKLEVLGGNPNSDAKFQGASFLGKKIVTSGTSLNYPGDGSDIQIPFFLNKFAKNAIVRIYDSRNQLIGQMNKENLHPGMQSINWDGIGLDAQIAPKDSYRFSVMAFDENNDKFFAETKSEGVITGVNFDPSGETVFTLADGKRVFLKDVQSFSVAGGSDKDKNQAGQLDKGQLTQNNQKAIENFEKFR